MQYHLLGLRTAVAKRKRTAHTAPLDESLSSYIEFHFIFLFFQVFHKLVSLLSSDSPSTQGGPAHSKIAGAKSF